MFTRDRLDRYVNNGLLSRKDKGNLSIYCYTPDAQFGKKWDDVTIACRGLILDDKDQLRAVPFRKFFNLNETPDTEVRFLPKEQPEVSEKLDGSLGISYRDDDGVVHFATKGSFESEQAAVCEKIWNEKYNFQFPVHWTIMVEIIHPVSKVVVGYDYEDLVLIGISDMYSGKDFSYAEVAKMAAAWGMRTCGSYSKTIDMIIDEQDKDYDNTEGYVLRYSNGLRVKIKNKMYLKFHRMVSQFTDKNVWDLMRHGEFERFLAECPEEYRQEVEDLARDIKLAHKRKLDECNDAFRAIPNYGNDKEFALHVLKEYPRISGVLFSMRKGKLEAVNKIIFNMIKDELGI